MLDILLRDDGLREIGVEVFSDAYNAMSPTAAAQAATSGLTELFKAHDYAPANQAIYLTLDDFMRSIWRGDRATAAMMLTDDFTGISHTGDSADKQQYLAIHFGQSWRRFEALVKDIEVSGGTAVVRGVVVVDQSDKEYPEHHKFTATLRATGRRQLSAGSLGRDYLKQPKELSSSNQPLLSYSRYCCFAYRPVRARQQLDRRNYHVKSESTSYLTGKKYFPFPGSLATRRISATESSSPHSGRPTARYGLLVRLSTPHFTGRATMEQSLEAMLAQWKFFYQALEGGTVELSPDGLTATGRIYLSEHGQSLTGVGNYNLSFYEDAYVREDGGWRFRTRTYRTIYQSTAPFPGRVQVRPGVPDS